MKLFICAVLLAIGFNCAAQYHGFVRIFDLQGSKVYKGRVVNITDSSVILKHGVEFRATDIGKIKTKRSAGHSIAVGTLIGFGAGTAVGLIANATYDGGGQLTLAGVAVFYSAGSAVLGVVGGFIGSAIKNPQTYVIGGDLDNWRAFKKVMGY